MDLIRQPRHIIRNAESDKAPIERLGKYETIAEQFRIIKSWEGQTNVWPLTFGRSILIGAATATGIYINHRFRAKIKIRSYGEVPTMIGLAVTPALFTSLGHSEFVLNRLLLLDVRCPLCLESKSALIQTCTGLFLPMIMAPLANFSVAAGSGAYNVPYIKDIKAISRTIFSVYQPMIPKIAMLFTFHALLASYITYSEIKSFIRILDLQYLKEEEKKEKFVQDDIF
ncbi:uncharacterized protein LOC105194761 [Solenopsis invicta]|uniref:uncharacterized protein LOC105194761 n=1 Tax=Solenopsis invicta TaxID=13686 RepID=UPI0001FEDF54|nr:uncharacterized protein LOC105194761 [Solenopsis invicta]